MGYRGYGIECIAFSTKNKKRLDRIITRVKKTGRNRSGNRGYRSNRPGPVPVPAGFKPAQIQILNLNSKKWKNIKKNLKNTSSCDEFNDVKFFQIFVHLVYFASI